MSELTGDVPDDVWTWLRETYDDSGVVIWLEQWRKSNVFDRAKMIANARRDPMGG